MIHALRVLLPRGSTRALALVAVTRETPGYTLHSNSLRRHGLLRGTKEGPGLPAGLAHHVLVPANSLRSTNKPGHGRAKIDQIERYSATFLGNLLLLNQLECPHDGHVLHPRGARVSDQHPREIGVQLVLGVLAAVEDHAVFEDKGL